MSRMADQHRKAVAASRKRVPDMWKVSGTDPRGERFDADFEYPELAEHVAFKMNGRDGQVAVTRMVYHGPKATYVPAEETPS